MSGCWLATGANAVTFTVTKTADTGDGVCNGDCSLREAINGVQRPRVRMTWSSRPGVFQLSFGELSITDNLEIRGQGPLATRIVQTGAARVFNINTALPVLLSGLTVDGGNAAAIGGGGILKQGAGDLTVQDSYVQNNRFTPRSARRGRRRRHLQQRAAR